MPLLYRPLASGTLLASFALPTSLYPNPALAPQPEAFYTLEPFPSAIAIAAFRFDTPALATDLEYSFACGQLAQWLSDKGIAPVAGLWAQAWATYSQEFASPHVNECWAQVQP